ncbi:MAG: Uma2 family endonuclease [Tunicatimonas sp.]
MRIDIVRYQRHLFPDLSVVCGPLDFTENRKDGIKNPMLLVEVLSPSTEGYDRGLKFKMYRSLPSFREYVLISQEEPQVEIYYRQDDAAWLYQVYQGLDATLTLQSIDHVISLEHIYQKVDFTDQFLPTDAPQ